MQKPENRRSFLERIGMGIGGTALVSAFPTFANSVSEKEEIYEGKKLRIALVGLGRYAGYLADSFIDAKYCELTGLVTGTSEKEETWGKKYNVPKQNIYNYKNFDKIADNKDIDLIYIVLPNSMHKEFAIRAAKAKKHIIVEKPMAITAADCLEMIKAAKENKVQLAMGYRLHYEPYHLEMKRLGQEKVLGKVKLIEVSLGYNTSGPAIGPKEWRLVKALSGGGPLMNLGVYCVQAARYITGEEPIAVTAQFGPISDKVKFSEVEESITWQMEFPSGAVSNSTSTLNAGIDRLYASTEDGFFELSPAVSYGPFRGRTNKGELNFADINQQAAQMDGISKVILDGNQLPEHIAGIEGWKDMKVLEAIYKSANAGGKKVKFV
jgi:predicted dehydrogenase